MILRDNAIGVHLAAAELQDVGTHAHVFRTGAGDVVHNLLLGVIDAARPLILETGLYDAGTIDSLCAALHEHLDNPETTTALGFWQGWGRRPAHA